MESPAKAILILPGASAPAGAAARLGVENSGNSRLKTRQTAPSADAAPSARRGRSPIPDPDRNTIGQPLFAVRPTHTKSWPPSLQPPGRHQRDQFGSETGSRWSSGLLFNR